MTNLGNNFYPKLVHISSELGMKPEDIIAIMVSESGMKPEIPNQAGSHAIGLIQFTDDTLKGLGFKKDWKEFGKVGGEEQLDYVKKYIENQMKFNGGRPLNAATFYVATYWPVALKLPGIRAGDPSTIITEINPPTARDGAGRMWSKKYYDIGFKIDPHMESNAYKTNQLFHGPIPGVITLGDMMRQVTKNRQSPTYRRAIAAMQNTTGYQATNHTNEYAASDVPGKPKDFFSGFFSKLENLLKQFVSASEEKHQFLITVGSSSDRFVTMEYARILSTALQEYMLAKTNICADDHNIEIECQASGDKLILFDAVKELSAGVADAFKHASKTLGSITAFALVTYAVKSDHPTLHPRRADLYARGFKFKITRAK